MKICQLLHAMTTGGAEVLANRMARHFANRHEVVFACLDGVGELGEKLRADGFTVEVMGRREGLDFSCMRRLGRFLKEEKVDVVHAHQYTPFVYAVAARVMSKQQPVVFTEHGRFHPDHPSRKRGLYNRVMLRRRDRVIAVGEQVKTALIENEFIPARRIEVIYNGINLDAFAPKATESASNLKHELGLPESAFVIAQVARLDPIKDHVTALRAIACSMKTHPNVHLLIIGNGPQQEAIEAEIKAQAVTGNVHLLGLRDDVACILKQSDMLLLTSVSEGIPLTLIEGMASGIPCLATDVGGINEVIKHKQTGLLVPAGDAEAIADAIVQLAEDSSLREQLAESGRQSAWDKFSEREMLRLYDRLFAEVGRS